MMSAEGLVGIPLPVFPSGFWEGADELMSLMSPMSPEGATPAGSDEPTRSGSGPDDRKLRRMKSNRESARRSRMRKQKHLEDLQNQAVRLRFQNRDVADRLGWVLQHYEVLRRENDRLRSESQELRRRLLDVRRFLLFRRLQHLASVNPRTSH